MFLSNMGSVTSIKKMYAFFPAHIHGSRLSKSSSSSLMDLQEAPAWFMMDESLLRVWNNGTSVNIVTIAQLIQKLKVRTCAYFSKFSIYLQGFSTSTTSTYTTHCCCLTHSLKRWSWRLRLYKQVHCWINQTPHSEMFWCDPWHSFKNSQIVSLPTLSDHRWWWSRWPSPGPDSRRKQQIEKFRDLVFLAGWPTTKNKVCHKKTTKGNYDSKQPNSNRTVTLSV